MAAATKPRIGVLALTLELYETLAPKLRAGRERWLRESVLPGLRAFAEVRFDRSVFRAEDVEAVVRGHEEAAADALLVVCLSYSPSQIALPALKRTRLPILIWNTQELAAVDGGYGDKQLVENHGVHGTQDLSSVLRRAGVPFEYVTSLPKEAAALAQIEDWAVAAAAATGLRKVRLGLLGYPFPGMGDFAADLTHLAATLGCQWTSLSVSDYNSRAASAKAADVRGLRAEYRRLYAVAANVTDADLDAAARAEIALRGMVRDYRLDALSYQFLAFGEDDRTQTLPFVAASRLLAEGVGFAGEGDLVGAAGTWLLNRLCPPASFSEIFTIDFGGEAVLLSHMGEANVAMADPGRKVALVVRPGKITPTRGRQLALVTTLRPGPATVCALALGPGQRWRLVTSRMHVERFGPLPSLAVPHWKAAPEGRGVREFLTAYAKAGGPHHSAICLGDATARVRQVAAMLDADCVEV